MFHELGSREKIPRRRSLVSVKVTPPGELTASDVSRVCHTGCLFPQVGATLPDIGIMCRVIGRLVTDNMLLAVPYETFVTRQCLFVG